MCKITNYEIYRLFNICFCFLNGILVSRLFIFSRSYVWDESKLNTGAGADLDKVELEDEEIVQQVQKGIESRFYKSGRFSPKMEKGVHHFHYLISNFMSNK